MAVAIALFTATCALLFSPMLVAAQRIIATDRMWNFEIAPRVQRAYQRWNCTSWVNLKPLTSPRRHDVWLGKFSFTGKQYDNINTGITIGERSWPQWGQDKLGIYLVVFDGATGDFIRIRVTPQCTVHSTTTVDVDGVGDNLWYPFPTRDKRAEHDMISAMRYNGGALTAEGLIFAIDADNATITMALTSYYTEQLGGTPTPNVSGSGIFVTFPRWFVDAEGLTKTFRLIHGARAYNPATHTGAYTNPAPAKVEVVEATVPDGGPWPANGQVVASDPGTLSLVDTYPFRDPVDTQKRYFASGLGNSTPDGVLHSCNGCSGTYTYATEGTIDVNSALSDFTTPQNLQSMESFPIGDEIHSCFSVHKDADGDVIILTNKDLGEIWCTRLTPTIGTPRKFSAHMDASLEPGLAQSEPEPMPVSTSGITPDFAIITWSAGPAASDPAQDDYAVPWQVLKLGYFGN